jgi:GNAT superfamily N-acetyltransferase
MEIAYLADYPEHLHTVATWVFGQWGHLLPGKTLEQVERTFGTHLQRDAVPLTVVALDEGKPVGTASLFLHDMSTRPELSPWLAAVYVLSSHRNRGIGSGLVQQIEAITERLQIPRLYLFTPDKQSFYARLGWVPMDTAEYRTEHVVIMTKSFTPGSAG